MIRSEAIARLKGNAAALRARGATALCLFGSTARDETNGSSDIDIFIDYDRTKKFSLVDLAGLKNFLEDQLTTKVDVMTRDSLHPRHRDRIEKSAIRVF
ncbi:nucleotidyltransferase family protein [Pseudorhodoplanes sp.]|uniref:nucleotidyltransferase family protein n=1 Tax=Pseudorhodoplanes sp. TaxID=1934341 RepID=UPI003D0A5791